MLVKDNAGRIQAYFSVHQFAAFKGQISGPGTGVTWGVGGKWRDRGFDWLRKQAIFCPSLPIRGLDWIYWRSELQNKHLVVEVYMLYIYTVCIIIYIYIHFMLVFYYMRRIKPGPWS